jgi:hypothetical protein
VVAEEESMCASQSPGPDPSGEESALDQEVHDEAAPASESTESSEVLPTDDAATDDGPVTDDFNGEEHPRGTLFLMLLLLILISAMWGYVYLEMIARS